MKILMDYPWPGNVRELENVVERALILSKNGILNFKQLQNNQITPYASHVEQSEIFYTLDEVMSQHIVKALKKTEGKINGPGGAAEILGIHANTLRARMTKLGIDFGKS